MYTKNNNYLFTIMLFAFICIPINAAEDDTGYFLYIKKGQPEVSQLEDTPLEKKKNSKKSINDIYSKNLFKNDFDLFSINKVIKNLNEHSKSLFNKLTKTNEEYSSKLNKNIEWTKFFTEENFIHINKESFLMKEKGHKRNIIISNSFYVMKTPVTQKNYFDVMNINPSYFSDYNFCPGELEYIDNHRLCPNNPVENISWYDSKLYILMLNAYLSEGQKKFRFCTDKEIEYVTRAGSKTEFFWGDNPSESKQYAWYNDNSNFQTRPVGTEKLPNPWGLYDILGNVWTWVLDNYNSHSKIIRGGCWNSTEDHLRSSYKDRHHPMGTFSNVGLRICRDI